MALSVGSPAPDFTLDSTSGEPFTLSESFRGTLGIVYFYPKDFSAGCTAEACSFRDSFEMFRNLDVPVVGISSDDIPTHHRFREAHQLPFHLLSDPDKLVAARYNVLVPLVQFVQRVTFLINETMTIAAVYQDLLDTRGHISTMIAQVRKNSANKQISSL